MNGLLECMCTNAIRTRVHMSAKGIFTQMWYFGFQTDTGGNTLDP